MSGGYVRSPSDGCGRVYRFVENVYFECVSIPTVCVMCCQHDDLATTGEVRIVAPLGAPRSPTSSPTMTASLVPLTGAAESPSAAAAGIDNNRNITSFESTTHFEERTTRYSIVTVALVRIPTSLTMLTVLVSNR